MDTAGTGESYLFCFREHKGGSTFYEEFNTYHWVRSPLSTAPLNFELSGHITAAALPILGSGLVFYWNLC